MSKGHRNDRRVARRVKHALSLAQVKHDNRLKREILDAVHVEMRRAARTLSEEQRAEVGRMIREASPVVGEGAGRASKATLTWPVSAAEMEDAPLIEAIASGAWERTAARQAKTVLRPDCE